MEFECAQAEDESCSGEANEKKKETMDCSTSSPNWERLVKRRSTASRKILIYLFAATGGDVEATHRIYSLALETTRKHLKSSACGHLCHTNSNLAEGACGSERAGILAAGSQYNGMDSTSTIPTTPMRMMEATGEKELCELCSRSPVDLLKNAFPNISELSDIIYAIMGAEGDLEDAALTLIFNQKEKLDQLLAEAHVGPFTPNPQSRQGCHTCEGLGSDAHTGTHVRDEEQCQIKILSGIFPHISRTDIESVLKKTGETGDLNDAAIALVNQHQALHPSSTSSNIIRSSYPSLHHQSGHHMFSPLSLRDNAPAVSSLALPPALPPAQSSPVPSFLYGPTHSNITLQGRLSTPSDFFLHRLNPSKSTQSLSSSSNGLALSRLAAELTSHNLESYADQFELMIRREQEFYNDYVVFYHSYSHAAIIYEVNSVIAQAVYGLSMDFGPLPRLLKQPFNECPEMKMLIERLSRSKNDHDTHFRNLAISVSCGLLENESPAYPLEHFASGYSNTDLSYLDILKRTLHTCGILNRNEVDTIIEKIIGLADEYKICRRAYGGTPSVDVCHKTGHMLQIFVHKDIVDYFAYPSHSGGRPKDIGQSFSQYFGFPPPIPHDSHERRDVSRSYDSCSAHTTGQRVSQARLFMYPDVFINESKCRIFHYSASSTYSQGNSHSPAICGSLDSCVDDLRLAHGVKRQRLLSRASFLAKLREILYPIIGTEEARRNARLGIEDKVDLYGQALSSSFSNIKEQHEKI